MSKKQHSYNKAIEEIQIILDELENDKLNIDDLSSKIKRATELIQYCKDTLFKVNTEIENMLKELD